MKTQLLKALFFLLFLGDSFSSFAQLPCNVLVGYWQNSWGATIRIKDIDTKYNVICLAFLEADKNSVVTDNTVNDLEFTPTNNAQVLADIPVVQAQGRKVLMSIGGGNGSFKLNSDVDKTTFVSKVKTAIQTYGVDGIDIDLEQSTYVTQTGTISSPSAHITRVIAAIQELLTWYQATYSKKMILTMAPEVAYTSGGLSSYMSSTYGVSYLAIIEALKADIDLLMVQLYNASGGNYSLVGSTVYNQATADFIVTQTEALIKGFVCQNGKGTYSGLSASKIAVALPATAASAGSGYTAPATVASAVNYLRGTGPKPGSYTLLKTGGYPELRGMMTWSINDDYGAGYAFANNYNSIFTTCLTAGIEEGLASSGVSVYPNPAQKQFTVENVKIGETLSVYNTHGQLLMQKQITDSKTTVDASTLPAGFYILNTETSTMKLIIE